MVAFWPVSAPTAPLCPETVLADVCGLDWFGLEAVLLLAVELLDVLFAMPAVEFWPSS